MTPDPNARSTTVTTPARLGLGGAATGGHGWGPVDDNDSINAIRRAYEKGIEFFDTADVYGLGHAERVLSLALGNHRHDVTIATKFGVRWGAGGKTWRDTSPGYLRGALDDSLRRLGVEQIDLYYVHWPDGVTPIEDTLEELGRQQRMGKIDRIGLSNHSHADFLYASTVNEIDSIQVQFSLIDRSAAQPFLDDPMTPNLVTWGSLGEGLLTGKYTEKSAFGDDDRRSRYPNFQGDRFRRNLRLVHALRAVAAEVGKSPAQTAVRWLLDTPGVGCVLCGAKTAKQVDENLGALGWRLPPDLHHALCAHAESITACDASVPT